MGERRSDVAFSPAVKAAQEARGSRAAYAAALERHDWEQELPLTLMMFVQTRDMFYLATASADGQPYVQHRGGPPGFLQVLDPGTLAFADFKGNKQYITVGNLTENPRVMLLLMDYPSQQRLKIWGRAEVVEGEGVPDALKAAHHGAQGERYERFVIVHIEAWDVNCPSHITPRFTRAELKRRGVELP